MKEFRLIAKSHDNMSIISKTVESDACLCEILREFCEEYDLDGAEVVVIPLNHLADWDLTSTTLEILKQRFERRNNLFARLKNGQHTMN